MSPVWCLCTHLLAVESSLFFFFNDTATTEIYTLSLHDALPIYQQEEVRIALTDVRQVATRGFSAGRTVDRKSTRLNSSHSQISYAVFCLKKKKNFNAPNTTALVHWRRHASLQHHDPPICS